MYLKYTHKLQSLIKATAFIVLSATTVLSTTAHSEDIPPLETVATFSQDLPPGNIAVSPTGRIFMSVHGFFGEPKAHVVEVLNNGKTLPYPNQEWSAALNNKGIGLNDVLGLQVDNQGILWLLDGQKKESTGRIVAWDTNTEKLHRVIYLTPPAAKANSFLNDLAVDLDNNAIYISDSAGAFIVVDLTTGFSRRLLEGSRYTGPEDIDMVIDKRTIMLGKNPARIGINPITIDATNTWVYWGAMSGTRIYRAKTKDLLNTKLSNKELEQRIVDYGKKPISDGSTIDNQGNVYITAITQNAIGVTQANGEYKILYQDNSLPWPDGFAIGADGYVYVTINALHRSPVLNGGKNTSKQGDFKIVRFKPLAKAHVGR